MQPWKCLQLSRRGMALNPSTGESFRMNETAAFILNLLQRDKTLQEVARSLADEFDCAYEAALSDAYEFMANLNIQGIGE